MYLTPIISTSVMSVGSTYTSTAGNQSVEIEQTGIVTSNGHNGGTGDPGGTSTRPRNNPDTANPDISLIQ
nr:hypothetical protein [uncultured Acetobacterium sp.]